MKRSRENGIPWLVAKQLVCCSKAEIETMMFEPAAAPLAFVFTAAGSDGVGAARVLTRDVTLQYVLMVRNTFEDDRNKYHEFTEVIKDLREAKIDTAGMTSRVKDLFKDHPSLILGFNVFLSNECKITLPSQAKQRKQLVEFNAAVNYVNKIRTRFENDMHIYEMFKEVLNMYHKRKSVQEVYQEVAYLFTQHVDLLDEFTHFFPDYTGPVSSILTGAGNLASRPEKTTGMLQERGLSQQAEQKTGKRRKISSNGGRGRAPERVGDETSQDRIPSSKLEKDQQKREGKVAAKDAAREGKENNLDASQRLAHKRKSTQRADELIEQQSQAGEGREALQGQSVSPLLEDEKKLSTSSSLQKEQQDLYDKGKDFFNKVKKRLHSHGIYKEFLKCFKIFSQEIISHSELQILLAEVLGKHSDLMNELNDLLTRRHKLELYFAGVSTGKKVDSRKGTTKMVRPKTGKGKDREWEQKNCELESPMEQEQPEMKIDNRVGCATQNEVPRQKAASILRKAKYSNQRISEPNHSNREQCTCSYLLLRDSYRKTLSIHRTELDREVLNDSCVSVKPRSKNHSFKPMRENPYEKSLFRCDEDHFELDMLVERAAATAQKVNDLVENIQDPKFKSTFVLDDQLYATNLRCIEGIYGDHGVNMINLLLEKPLIALPFVLTRLKQKHDEWSRCRIAMNKVWAEVYSKNYHTSLEHRGNDLSQAVREVELHQISN